MIVCHCNRISHHDIARVSAELAQSRPDVPVTAEAVYAALGKQPRCGCCLELAASFLAEAQTAENVDPILSDAQHQLADKAETLTSPSRIG
ncbi:MAG: hypothetical protein P8Y67_12210 [Alphaproteobacteria bacterium]